MSNGKGYICNQCHSERLMPGRRCPSCGSRFYSPHNKRPKIPSVWDCKSNNWKTHWEFLHDKSLIE